MFDKKFQLRYFEMDPTGKATPITMLMLFEEAAAEHCQDIDNSLYDLMSDNIGWVLLAGYMEMYRYPSYRENIQIRTWISHFTRVKGIRENIVFTESGEIIGRARGSWVFFDIERRRPVKIYPDILKRWGGYSEKSIDHNIAERIDTIESGSFHDQFLVHRYDLDTNKHVNNIRYFQWLLETIPDEIMDNYDLSNIDGRFVGEAQYGQMVESISKPLKEPDSYIHTVKDRNSREVFAKAVTNWTKRG